jgi:hypothetical protein
MAEEPTTYRNSRLNFLAAVAFVVVILCLVAVVILTITDEFAKGVITLILGRFLGYIDNIYNFEFGTTRGSKDKDDVITNLAAANPNAPSEVRKAIVAGEVKAANGGNTTTENMTVAAENVTVQQPPKGT